MKKNLAVLFALTGWFAIIEQFILMLGSRALAMSEITIEFFSYFTILTNIIVAVYFTCLLFSGSDNSKLINKPGTLTAITVYIFMVGLVYQVTLRHLWNPEGMQQIVDELLHTVIPLLAVVFWILYEKKSAVKYSQITKWCIYPLIYLVCILIRGSLSGYYPYPFLDVVKIGMPKTLINCSILVLVFLVIAVLFIFAGKKMSKKESP